MFIVAAIAFDGIFIHKLPLEALKYPVFCFLIVFGTCGIEIVRSIRKQKAEEETVEAEPVHYDLKNFLIMVVMLIVYVILLWLIGFIAASIALTIVFTVLYRLNKPVLVNVIATVVIIAVFFIFGKVLYIFLPQGLLFKLIF